MKYPKIDSVFKRDERGKIIVGDYSTPEIEYLGSLEWIGTEKVDGQNVRVVWDGEDVSYMGRTDRGVVQKEVLEWLTTNLAADVFEASGIAPCILYGEGYGFKVQEPMGSRYVADGTARFILFDVYFPGPALWLEWTSIKDVAKQLGISHAPVVFVGSLHDAVRLIQFTPPTSIVADDRTMIGEGFVLRPACDLQDRRGNRIITKIKVKDFQ